MNFANRWHAFFDRTVPNIVLRMVVMVFGLAFVAASVGLTRATGLGTSPISCVPTTLSFFTPLTIGGWTFVMNVLFVLIQILLLRRDFKIVQLLQVPYVFVFSALIDFFVPIFELVPMPNYLAQLFFSVVGCFMTAFGVFLQVKASFLTLPGEGIVLSVAKVSKWPFPKCKIGFDASNVIIATVASLVAMGGLYGVREGTIISALAVGAIVGLFNRLFSHFEKFCPIKGHLTLTATTMAAPDEASVDTAQKTEPRSAENPAETPLVITISRQFGSGGREIGQAVGKLLNIPVFDRSLIELTAKESGLTPDYVKTHEQEVRRGIMYNLYMQSYASFGIEPTQTDELWLAQARAITRIADQGSCVIVGRCAGAVLQNRPNVFNVFVHAPLVPRIARVMKRENVDHMKAAAMIEKVDKERKDHCEQYVGSHWTDINSYHLALDSSVIGVEDSATLVAKLAQHAYPEAPLTPTPKKPTQPHAHKAQ